MTMGNNQSVRESHFQRAEGAEEAPTEAQDAGAQHISISNKMVERLVEDAALAGQAAAAEAGAPRGPLKEKMFMEKLLYLDENHSQRYRITVDDLKETAARIELRTANMVSVEPVCAHCKQSVIDCYDAAGGGLACADAVGAFSKCVKSAAAARLRARTQRDARDLARRRRHVAHAREHALRDLSPPAD
ncbi:uncharacterized protein [Battus philenor]|uniref:uncharacterized protein n=1 Tax=Battus philenor TaxID=42288 RepID=UPI0035D0448B